MKNYLFLTFLSTFMLISCKNEQKNEADNAFAKADSAKTSNIDATYKQSLAQWSLNAPFKDGSMDPMEFAQIAKDLGYTGVEYVTQLYPQMQDKENYQQTVTEWAKEMKKRADMAGVENVLIMVDHDGELADPNDSNRFAAVQIHKYWMDAAKIMGAHSVRANLFGELDPAKWHELSVASLKELGAYGKEIGVNIVIENHGGWSSDAAKLVAVMKEVNMKTVGTLPDFGNFCVARRDGDRWGSPCINEYDAYKGVEELMEFAVGVSAKSYNFDENGDETKLDYQRLIQIAHDGKTDRFQGYIGTEYEGDLEDPKEGIKLTQALVAKSTNNLK